MLDFGECGDESVPLGGILFAAFSVGEGVFECCVIGPDLEFGEGGFAFEELVGEIISDSSFFFCFFSNPHS